MRNQKRNTLKALSVLVLTGLWLGGLLTACGDATVPAQLTGAAANNTPATTLTGAAVPATPIQTTAVSLSPSSISIAATPATIPSTSTSNPALSPTASATVALKAALLPDGPAIKESKTFDDFQLDMAVTPGKIGNNTFLARLSTKDGQAITDASLVRVECTHLEMDMGIAKLVLMPVGSDAPGLYSGQGYLTSMYGKYNMAVFVTRPGQNQVSTDFEISVTSSK